MTAPPPLELKDSQKKVEGVECVKVLSGLYTCVKNIKKHCLFLQ